MGKGFLLLARIVNRWFLAWFLRLQRYQTTLGVFTLNFLDQVLNFRVHQDPMEGLLKYGWRGPTLRISGSVVKVSTATPGTTLLRTTAGHLTKVRKLSLIALVALST